MSCQRGLEIACFNTNSIGGISGGTWSEGGGTSLRSDSLSDLLSAARPVVFCRQLIKYTCVRVSSRLRSTREYKLEVVRRSDQTGRSNSDDSTRRTGRLLLSLHLLLESMHRSNHASATQGPRSVIPRTGIVFYSRSPLCAGTLSAFQDPRLPPAAAPWQSGGVTNQMVHNSHLRGNA